MRATPPDPSRGVRERAKTTLPPVRARARKALDSPASAVHEKQVATTADRKERKPERQSDSPSRGADPQRPLGHRANLPDPASLPRREDLQARPEALIFLFRGFSREAPRRPGGDGNANRAPPAENGWHRAQYRRADEEWAVQSPGGRSSFAPPTHPSATASRVARDSRRRVIQSRKAARTGPRPIFGDRNAETRVRYRGRRDVGERKVVRIRKFSHPSAWPAVRGSALIVAEKSITRYSRVLPAPAPPSVRSDACNPAPASTSPSTIALTSEGYSLANYWETT